MVGADGGGYAVLSGAGVTLAASVAATADGAAALAASAGAAPVSRGVVRLLHALSVRINNMRLAMPAI
jgi:hypothetical protein